MVDLVSDSDDCDLRGDLKFRVAHGGPGGRMSVLRWKERAWARLKGPASITGCFDLCSGEVKLLTFEKRKT